MKTPSQLRSVDIIKALSPRSAWRLASGILRARFDRRFAGYPFAVCWFTNFTCNAHCQFCCKAKEISAGNDDFPPLSPDDTECLLSKIRPSVDVLYLSGGEPLIHPHIAEIVQQAKQQAFRIIGMSTNGIALKEHLDLLDCVHALSISLHSSDPREHARHLGVAESVAHEIFDTLALVEDCHRRKGLRALLNCVITRKNMDGVLKLLDFAGERGFLLEVVPANIKGHVPDNLKKSPEYRSLIDELITLRKSGRAEHLGGSTRYLEYIRDFDAFRCFPYGIPNVMPDGRLCTPCDISEQYALNVLDFEDLDAAVKASLGHLGSYPCRRAQCFKAGIIERSHLYGLLCLQ
jgi:MoaA/NifB/PqqE/SkfB family radical SAM enzyme